MSTGIDYALLFTSSDASGASPLLQALYGDVSQPAGPGAALSALQNAERNQTKDVATEAAQPQVARDIAAFTKAVETATSPRQLLNNPAVMKVLLTASGLASQIGFTALAQKALLSNPFDQNSLVNKLPDQAWSTMAQTYQFATMGLAVIQQPSVISTVTNAYAEALWQQSLNASYPGLANALAFRQQASSITNVQQVLGDAMMFDVVTTALGIPEGIVVQSTQAQAQTISAQLDVANFQKPKFVEQFVQRYMVNMAMSASASSQPSLTQLAITAQGLVA